MVSVVSFYQCLGDDEERRERKIGGGKKQGKSFDLAYQKRQGSKQTAEEGMRHLGNDQETDFEDK